MPVETFTDEQIAAFIYEVEQEIRRAENEVERLKGERDAMTNDLAERLGPGGAVFIQDGATVAYVGPGTRVLDKGRLDNLVAAHEGDLPTALVPREETVVKYPSVSALDKAEAVLRAMGVDPGDLVTYRSGKRHTIQFREVEA